MPDKPNIIFIMLDQLRHDFLSVYGADFIDTPNIDRLASRGVRYDRAISQHPVCVPARCALMTGMHGQRTGVLDNGNFLRPDLHDLGIDVWPQILQDAGYYTAAIGKMHFYPWDLRLGFQYRKIAEDKRWVHIRDDYYHFLRDHGYRKYHGNEHEGYYEHRGAIIDKLPLEMTVDRYVGNEACHFIDHYGGEGPFAMMVGFPGPHCPYDPTPEYLEQVDADKLPTPIPEVEGNHPRLRQDNIDGNKGAWNGVDYTIFTDDHKQRIRQHYAASVKQIDDEIGRILDSLEKQNLLDNTVILFSSDHGDYLGDHNLIGKGTYFEASCHVPMIAWVPWMGSSEVCETTVTLTDITATILGFAGCEIPEYMDAIPLPGLGLAGEEERGYIIAALSGAWMIDDGTWRLSLYSTGEHMLFNELEDPQELHNHYFDPAYLDLRTQLEAKLFREVMAQQRDSHLAQRVYISDLSQYSWFGREGWQRPYPRRVDSEI